VPNPIILAELLEKPGVIAAIRWHESNLGKNLTSPPQLAEHVGRLDLKQAETLMIFLEDSLSHNIHLSFLHDLLPEDRSLKRLPFDAMAMRSQKYTLMATLNRVGVVLQNREGADLKAIADAMILVDNYER
jgi:hypothetical protein